MPDWPITGDGQLFATYGTVTSLTNGTPATSGAGTGIYGTWVEIVTTGATRFDAEGFYYTAVQGTGNALFSVDIGIGASAGAVSTIVPKLYFNLKGSTLRGGMRVHIPISIARNTSVWVRIAADVASSVLTNSITLYGTGFRPGRQLASTCVTYNHIGTPLDAAALGASPSPNTFIDPGAVAEVFSAWTNITTPVFSSIQRLTSLLLLTFANGPTDFATATSARWTVDIGKGATAGTVVPLWEGLPVVINLAGDQINAPFRGPMSAQLNFGEIIWARVKCNTAIATLPERRMGVIMYAFS